MKDGHELTVVAWSRVEDAGGVCSLFWSCLGIATSTTGRVTRDPGFCMSHNEIRPCLFDYFQQNPSLKAGRRVADTVYLMSRIHDD